MSHFVTLVFTKKEGRTVEELLAPFDEGLSYPPYVEYTREQAIQKKREDIEAYKKSTYAKYLANPAEYEQEYKNRPVHIDFIKNEFPKRLNWTDDECYQAIAECWDEELIKPNGDLLSIYNPNSKWDWYQIGGRWDHYLKTLGGEAVNKGFVSEIDWKDATPFAFVTPIGEWCERGKMGWWACVSDEKEESKWEAEFKEFIQSLDGNTMVTVVDCHI